MSGPSGGSRPAGRPRGAGPGSGRDGAALILALVLLAALAVVVVAGTRARNADLAGEALSRNRLQAAALAESGFILACGLLARDETQAAGDHYREAWARFFRDPETRSQLSEAGLAGPPRVLEWFTDGALSGSVTDESGKFPLAGLLSNNRAAYAEILVALLRNPPFNLSERKAREILLAVTDWLDADDAPGREGSAVGAEDERYREAETWYACRNSRMDSLFELLLVRGISPELINGADGQPGLKDLVSVWNAKGINVNTAPRPLLAALAWKMGRDKARTLAADLDAFRLNRENAAVLREPTWYRAAAARFRSAELAEETITVKSSCFTIEMTGRRGNAAVTLFACVKREPDSSRAAAGAREKIQVLYRRLM